MDKPLKAVELANMLGIQRHIIYKWRKLGMPYINAPGMGARYQFDWAIEWLRKYKTTDTGPLTPHREKPLDARPPAMTKRTDITSRPSPVKGKLPHGVKTAGPGRNILMIHYQAPDGQGGTKRIRETSGTADPDQAARERARRLKAAWENEPLSDQRDRYLSEAAETLGSQ